MGILDDAIREHLELKRKHGVPEDEVERQEEEALGPARRDVAQQPEDAEIAADAGDEASLFDGGHRDAPVAEAPALADDETVIAEPPPAEHAPAHEEPQAEPFAEESPEAEPPVADHTGMEPPLRRARAGRANRTARSRSCPRAARAGAGRPLPRAGAATRAARP